MTKAWRAARVLVERGIPVFPCQVGAKPPLTRHGLSEASVEAYMLNGWEKKWPDANIAIPTGHASGMYVIDIDRKNDIDGLETLQHLELMLGDLPETLTARTPSGGEHRYFKMPDLSLRNTAGKLGPGLDTRGDGGYVLVPPSRIGQREYAWARRMPPAELPKAWLTELLPPERAETGPWTPPTEQAATRLHAWCMKALEDERGALAAEAKGGRNHALWKSAASLGGLVHCGAFSAEDVRKALGWSCAQWRSATPGKDRQTLENGLAFGLSKPRNPRV